MKHSQLSQEQKIKLDRYRALVKTYHQTLDLVSTNALSQFDDKISDALIYAHTIQQMLGAPSTLLDVGSGAGLPAVPLAIALPETQVVMVERRRRRTSFLHIVKTQLRLDNVAVLGDDVQNIDHLPPVTVVSAMAVGKFSDLYCLTRHLHDNTVLLLSRKGHDWQNEKNDLEQNLGSVVKNVSVEQLSSDGRLVAMQLDGGLSCPSSA